MLEYQNKFFKEHSLSIKLPSRELLSACLHPKFNQGQKRIVKLERIEYPASSKVIDLIESEEESKKNISFVQSEQFGLHLNHWSH